jgi:hypothetical protein
MISFEQLPGPALLDRLKGSEMEEASDSIDVMPRLGSPGPMPPDLEPPWPAPPPYPFPIPQINGAAYPTPPTPPTTASDGSFGGNQGLDNNVQPIATLD